MSPFTQLQLRSHAQHASHRGRFDAPTLLRRFGLAALAALVALVATAGVAVFILPSGSASSGKGAVPLLGRFNITAGSCNPVTGVIGGSYFKLIFPGGNIHTGYFFENTNSLCFNKSFTTISPGSDGGLTTGGFQPKPRVAFTAEGDARADAIIRPVLFAAFALSLSTQSTDPQTNQRVSAPVVESNRGRLSGNIEALSAEWRNSYFNQGSPKPRGLRPGLTRPISGEYNARTRAFTLNWTSTIIGGPFTGFIGQWHLEGTFIATG